MVTQSRTGVLLDWINSTGYSDLPANVQEKARFALYDGLGSVLACSTLPVAHRLNRFAGLSGSGGLVELYTAATGTWTLLLTIPGGPTCLLGSGDEWEGWKPSFDPKDRTTSNEDASHLGST